MSTLVRFLRPALYSPRHLASAHTVGALLPCLAALPAVTSELNPLVGVLWIILLIISLGIHEAAHAWVALKCGDPTARDLGRITLNPIVHIDLFMTILLPAMLYVSTGGAFVFGGAKPVPVSFHRLRHPWRDMALVAIAGPLSNLLLAVFFLLLWKFFVNTGWYNGAAAVDTERHKDLLPTVLDRTLFSNLLLAVFNFVPIPPLDGSRVMAWLLPASVRSAYVAMESFGLLIVMGLVYFSSSFMNFILREVYSISRFLDSVVSLGGLW